MIVAISLLATLIASPFIIARLFLIKLFRGVGDCNSLSKSAAVAFSIESFSSPISTFNLENNAFSICTSLSDNVSGESIMILSASILPSPLFTGYYAMPGAYRTPELVAYAKSESNICKESDVFQLGLVLCVLFTGRNPLRPTEDTLSEIVLLPIPNGKGKYLNKSIWIIRQMLKIDKTERMPLDQAMKRFNLLFEEYSKAREDLEGVAI